MTGRCGEGGVAGRGGNEIDCRWAVQHVEPRVAFEARGLGDAGIAAVDGAGGDNVEALTELRRETVAGGAGDAAQNRLQLPGGGVAGGRDNDDAAVVAGAGAGAGAVDIENGGRARLQAWTESAKVSVPGSSPGASVPAMLVGAAIKPVPRKGGARRDIERRGVKRAVDGAVTRADLHRRVGEQRTGQPERAADRDRAVHQGGIPIGTDGAAASGDRQGAGFQAVLQLHGAVIEVERALPRCRVPKNCRR